MLPEIMDSLFSEIDDIDDIEGACFEANESRIIDPNDASSFIDFYMTPPLSRNISPQHEVPMESLMPTIGMSDPLYVNYVDRSLDELFVNDLGTLISTPRQSEVDSDYSSIPTSSIPSSPNAGDFMLSTPSSPNAMEDNTSFETMNASVINVENIQLSNNVNIDHCYCKAETEVKFIKTRIISTKKSSTRRTDAQKLRKLEKFIKKSKLPSSRNKSLIQCPVTITEDDESIDMDPFISRSNSPTQSFNPCNRTDSDIYSYITAPGPSNNKSSSKYKIVDGFKRASHNAKERERRYNLKNNLEALRNVVPRLKNKPKASMATVLEEASLEIVRQSNTEMELIELRRQNAILKQKSMALMLMED